MRPLNVGFPDNNGFGFALKWPTIILAYLAAREKRFHANSSH